MATSHTAYKIRDRSTGLYSFGGAYPRWGKAGKTWHSLNAFKNHMALFPDGRGGYKTPESWEVIEVECITAESPGMSVAEFVSKHPKKRKLNGNVSKSIY